MTAPVPMITASKSALSLKPCCPPTEKARVEEGEEGKKKKGQKKRRIRIENKDEEQQIRSELEGGYGG